MNGPVTRRSKFGLLAHAASLTVVSLILGAAPAAGGSNRVTPAPAVTVEAQTELDSGFGLLYLLRFSDAREQFGQWRRLHPADPMGPTAIAAGYLFEEFNVQGVLTSEFFLDDDRLLGGIKGTADPDRAAAFRVAIRDGREAAKRALSARPGDANAWLALTLTIGMEGNYASLIERRQLDGLRLIREADRDARRLLAVNADSADAYLAIGAARYIVGCLPIYKRALLWFGGVTGDRQEGMAQLAVTASRGRYLRPFAKVLLFLASLREGQPDRARRLVDELMAEFPLNPLFARERAKLERTP